jgi:hypothetical protein
MSRKLPDIAKGLKKLNPTKLREIDSCAELFRPISTFEGEMAAARDRLPDNFSQRSALEKLVYEVEHSFASKRVGALLSDYVLDRSKQFDQLAKYPVEFYLSLVSQGISPVDIAKIIGVSYDTFHEYFDLAASDEQRFRAQALAADSLISEAQNKLHAAQESEEISQAKAIADFNLKLARVYNSDKYVEKKPAPAPRTAVQINNMYEGESMTSAGSAPTAFLQIVHHDPDDLPALKPHRFQEQEESVGIKNLPGIVDGEFTFFEDDD